MSLLTRIIEKAPTLIGWLLAAVSTVTLYAVEYATIKGSLVDHERRMNLAEQEIKDLRQQIGSIQLDVRESATILRVWSREGVPKQ